MQISFQNKLIGRLLQLVSSWTKYSAKINIEGIEHMQAVRQAGKPVLWSTWHGQTMLTIGMFLQEYWRKQAGVKTAMIMIPDDWRGESLFAWTSYIGLVPQPMDLENKGMGTARKFAQMVKNIKREKLDNYIAPDGPSGPSYVVKPGLAFLAQKVGAPILPIGSYARHAYEIPRWDTYTIPYPFSRIEIVVGKPVDVPRKSDMDVINEKIKLALHNSTLQAKANYYAGKGEHH